MTYDNREAYVKAVLNTRLNENNLQIEKIKEGLFESINAEALLFMNWKDLERKVSGSTTLDLDLLKKNTNYGMDKNDNVAKWFWQALEKFNNEFVWGRSRLPISQEGFNQQHYLNRKYSNYPDISLPAAHTCGFSIDLPQYSSYEILYKKLLYAISYCTEIDGDYSPSSALEDL